MTHMDQYIIPAGNAAEAAPGVERLDVKAVNRKQDRALYAGREKVYPKLAHGRFRTVKWLVMAVTLGIYYALPWLRWHRGPDLPDQAVLLDMAHNRFFFFFLEIWPQEFYFVTGLLVLAALALFLVTSAAGRVWCGYTCPQTVWTDLMVLVERFWQGDRNARIRLDKARWGPVKLFKKGMTHLSWLAIGVGYRWRLRLLFPRRADACRRAPRRHGAGHRLSLPRHLHAHDLRARRHRPRAGLHLHVPLAAHPGRHGRPRDAAGELPGRIAASRAAPTRRASPGRGAATASTARPASPSARPASTSATARSSNASSARCASMPATTSWTRSAGRAG